MLGEDAFALAQKLFFVIVQQPDGREKQSPARVQETASLRSQ